MNRLTRIGIAAALAAASALAISQAPPGPGGPPAPNPEAQAKSAIEARQGLFKLIANQNAILGGMQRGQREFDAALAAKSAARVQMLADMIPELFMANTTAVKTFKTAALDGIWTSQPDFKSKADALSKAAGAVVDAAKTGDKAATTAAIAAIGKNCGACHDNFRAKP